VQPDDDELDAAAIEFCRRINVLTESGVASDEATRIVTNGDKPIIEGESCADTALRLGVILPEREKPVQSISYEELVQALKGVRIWVRQAPGSSTAYLMHVLHPEDAARDIFFKAMTVKDE
jgi:hypothetical protein